MAVAMAASMKTALRWLFVFCVLAGFALSACARYPDRIAQSGDPCIVEFVICDDALDLVSCVVERAWRDSPSFHAGAHAVLAIHASVPMHVLHATKTLGRDSRALSFACAHSHLVAFDDRADDDDECSISTHAMLSPLQHDTLRDIYDQTRYRSTCTVQHTLNAMLCRMSKFRRRVVVMRAPPVISTSAQL